METSLLLSFLVVFLFEGKYMYHGADMVSMNRTSVEVTTETAENLKRARDRVSPSLSLKAYLDLLAQRELQKEEQELFLR